MLKKPFDFVEHFGDALVEGFHLIGLFVVGASIIWASWAEVFKIIESGGPGLKDVLLLFIYLELGAMVGIYFKTKRMPVRFLIYIAITALTRVLAVDIKTMESMHMLMLTASILILSAAVLMLKIGSTRFSTSSEGQSRVKELQDDI